MKSTCILLCLSALAASDYSIADSTVKGVARSACDAPDPIENVMGEGPVEHGQPSSAAVYFNLELVSDRFERPAHPVRLQLHDELSGDTYSVVAGGAQPAQWLPSQSGGFVTSVLEEAAFPGAVMLGATRVHAMPFRDPEAEGVFGHVVMQSTPTAWGGRLSARLGVSECDDAGPGARTWGVFINPEAEFEYPFHMATMLTPQDLEAFLQYQTSGAASLAHSYQCAYVLVGGQAAMSDDLSFTIAALAPNVAYGNPDGLAVDLIHVGRPLNPNDPLHVSEVRIHDGDGGASIVLAGLKPAGYTIVGLRSAAAGLGLVSGWPSEPYALDADALVPVSHIYEGEAVADEPGANALMASGPAIQALLECDNYCTPAAPEGPDVTCAPPLPDVVAASITQLAPPTCANQYVSISPAVCAGALGGAADFEDKVGVELTVSLAVSAGMENVFALQVGQVVTLQTTISANPPPIPLQPGGCGQCAMRYAVFSFCLSQWEVLYHPSWLGDPEEVERHKRIAEFLERPWDEYLASRSRTEILETRCLEHETNTTTMCSIGGTP